MTIKMPRLKTLLIVVVVSAGMILPSAYFYRQYQQVQRKLDNPNELVGEEVKNLVALVGNLMVLPTDEDPTVATISDITRLQNQPFFTNAQNGDKVLIYTNARKAILYRPGTDKIIEVAPLTLGASATLSGQVIRPVLTGERLRFVLYNGTNIVGLTRRYETTLSARLTGAQVVDRDNAARRDYEKSILVDIGGSHPRASEIADALKLPIGSLPAGETKPEGADFLIIVGSDGQ